MSSHDNQVVVIGAGVAGLAAAAWLSRQGIGVQVLEAASKIGGCCGTTDLGGYHFNDGAQYIMLPQLVRLILDHLGIDSARLPLRRAHTPLQTELDDGTRVRLHADLHIERLQGGFDPSRARADLDRMLARWQPLLDALTGDDWLLRPIRPFDAARRLGRHLPLFSRSLQAELNALFPDPSFRAVMAGHMLFAGAPANRFPAPSILALVSVIVDGLHIPERGMSQLPEVLAEAALAHGASIAMNAPVRRILRTPRGGFSVTTGDGNRIAARHVISTASPYATLGRLMEGEPLPSAWRHRLARPRLSMKVLSVQLGLRGEPVTLSHLNHSLPPASGLAGYFAPAPDSVQWVYVSVPSLVVPSLAPPGCAVVEVYPAIPQGEAAATWDATRRERLAEAAVDWLRAREPIDVTVRRVRSPKDFEDQLGLLDGGIYGVDPAAGFGALFPQRTPVPGVYLAGQSCFPGFGVPMAAISGVRAAQMVSEEAARA